MEESVLERLEALQRRLEIVEATLEERPRNSCSVEESLARIADALAPQPADINAELAAARAVEAAAEADFQDLATCRAQQVATMPGDDWIAQEEVTQTRENMARV